LSTQCSSPLPGTTFEREERCCGQRQQATMRTSFWRALLTISDMFAGFSTEMNTTPMSRMSPVARFVYREDPPMPRSHRIMWTAQSCSCSNAWTLSKSWTRTELPERSNTRAFPMQHPRMTILSKKRVCCCVLQDGDRARLRPDQSWVSSLHPSGRLAGVRDGAPHWFRPCCRR
jgi:hypothetical protein